MSEREGDLDDGAKCHCKQTYWGRGREYLDKKNLMIRKEESTRKPKYRASR